MSEAASGKAGGFFDGAPWLDRDERDELLAGLAQLDARLGDAGAGVLGWRGRAAAVLAPEPGVEVPVARRGWLDLVADLVEASAAATGRGLTLEAVALEGVAGRLLGVLVGDGPCERTRLEGR